MRYHQQTEIAFFFKSAIPGPDPVTPETVKEKVGMQKQQKQEYNSRTTLHHGRPQSKI
jgi:hypothetical protein